MTCDGSVYHGGALAVEGGTLNSANELDFLYEPSTPLKKGNYTTNIQKETEHNQYCYTNGTNSKELLIQLPEFIKTSKEILSSIPLLFHILFKLEEI